MQHDSAPSTRKSSGGVRYGDILAKIKIMPTQQMLDLAAQANVPGGNGYAPTDIYDPIAIALYWAALGYKVMPLKSIDEHRDSGLDDSQMGKVPALTGGQYEQGTRDPEVIQSWWGTDPGRGVGLLTQANHLLVVDIDKGNHFSGELTFMELAGELVFDTTQVPCSKSPSYHGGYHLFWKLPRSFPKMSLPAVSTIARHVDIPWFVVAPGSWKYTTLGYDRKETAIKGIGIQTWYAGDPRNIPMAPKPLLDKLMRRGVIKGVQATEVDTAKRDMYKLGSDGEIDLKHYQANGIQLGLVNGQNGALYRIACKLAGRSVGMPKDEAIAWCWDVISRSPSDPHKGSWRYEQVVSLVNGAYKHIEADNAAKDRELDEFITNWFNNKKDANK